MKPFTFDQSKYRGWVIAIVTATRGIERKRTSVHFGQSKRNNHRTI